MAGRWHRCLFSFKARARSPKGKGAEKVWLINCSIEAFDEIDCQRVFELHSVEEHDGCFSTHYVYLETGSRVFCPLSGAFIMVERPTKIIPITLKLHPFPPGWARTYYSLYAESHPFSKASDPCKKNVFHILPGRDIVSLLHLRWGVKISNGEMSITMFSSSWFSEALLSSLFFSLSPSLILRWPWGLPLDRFCSWGALEKGQFRSSAL